MCGQSGRDAVVQRMPLQDLCRVRDTPRPTFAQHGQRLIHPCQVAAAASAVSISASGCCYGREMLCRRLKVLQCMRIMACVASQICTTIRNSDLKNIDGMIAKDACGCICRSWHSVQAQWM